jgi:hypothetical protein
MRVAMPMFSVRNQVHVYGRIGQVLLVLIQQAELRVGILFTYFTETTFYF